MSVQKSVQRGVALLDEKYPGWYKKINPATIDISTLNYCILGQVYGDFGLGCAALGTPNIFTHGFVSLFHHRQLEDEWRTVIAKKRLQDITVPSNKDKEIVHYA